MTIHQLTQDIDFIELQDRIRTGCPTSNDCKRLIDLNIHKLSVAKRTEIETSAFTIHLFATKQQCSDYNISSLIKEHSSSHPVAVIKSKLERKYV